MCVNARARLCDRRRLGGVAARALRRPRLFGASPRLSTSSSPFLFVHVLSLFSLLTPPPPAVFLRPASDPPPSAAAPQLPPSLRPLPFSAALQHSLSSSFCLQPRFPPKRCPRCFPPLQKQTPRAAWPAIGSPPQTIQSILSAHTKSAPTKAAPSRRPRAKHLIRQHSFSSWGRDESPRRPLLLCHHHPRAARGGLAVAS